MACIREKLVNNPFAVFTVQPAEWRIDDKREWTAGADGQSPEHGHSIDLLLTLRQLVPVDRSLVFGVEEDRKIIRINLNVLDELIFPKKSVETFQKDSLKLRQLCCLKIAAIFSMPPALWWQGIIVSTILKRSQTIEPLLLFLSHSEVSTDLAEIFIHLL